MDTPIMDSMLKTKRTPSAGTVVATTYIAKAGSPPTCEAINAISAYRVELTCVDVTWYAEEFPAHR